MQGSGQRVSGWGAASLERTLDFVERLDHIHVPKSGRPSVVVMDGRLETVEKGLQPLVREVDLHDGGSPSPLKTVPLLRNPPRLGETRLADRVICRSPPRIRGEVTGT